MVVQPVNVFPGPSRRCGLVESAMDDLQFPLLPFQVIDARTKQEGSPVCVRPWS